MSELKTTTELMIEARIAGYKQQRESAQEQVKGFDEAIKVQNKLLRDEWNRKASEQIDQLHSRLEKSYKVSRTDLKYQKIFQLAWDRGHSEGLEHVEFLFDEMAELL